MSTSVEHPAARPGRSELVFFLVLFTYVGALTSVAYYERIGARSAQYPWWGLHALLTTLLLVSWGFAIWRVTVRFPLGRRQPPSHWGTHALTLVALSAAFTLVGGWLDALHLVPPGEQHENALQQFAFTALSYLLFATITHGIDYIRRHRTSAHAGRRLQSALGTVRRDRAEAELRALKAELNPHLLASALESVTPLVRTNATAAERALADLGDLVRSAVSRFATTEVTLAEEIEGLEPFLAVERARFGDEFVVDWNVPEPVRQAVVPRMILQVLIDSAAKHGYSAAEETTVRVAATRAAAELQIVAACARPAAETRKELSRHADADLAHIQSRLRELYGDRISVELETSPRAGAIARVSLPWREDMSPAVAEPPAAPVEPDPLPALGRRAMVSLAAWFVGYVAFTAVHDATVPLSGGAVRPLSGVLLVALIGAIVTTAILYVALRISRTRELGAALRLHARAVLAFVPVLLVARVIPSLLIGAPYEAPSPLRLARLVLGAPLYYGLFAALVQAIVYAHRLRRSEDTRVMLSSELDAVSRRRTAAELRALKAELNPHFLGNALGAVSSLIRTDPATAERVLTELSELLRSTVATLDVQEVTLSEEIRGLTPFLTVERARFGDRLAISWDVDADAMDAHVPHMILQPLVENAIKHGLSARSGPGRVTVSARRRGQQLELAIRDNGVGLAGAGHSASHPGRAGIGLANTRARLTELYGPVASLDLEPVPSGGAEARLAIPWR